MRNSEWDLSQFSKHLFWDIDVNSLSPSSNKSFIVKRVLEYGLLSDWFQLNEYLSISEIAELSQGFKDLDKKTLSFISTLSGKPRSTFQCYTTQQSTNPHWNF